MYHVDMSGVSYNPTTPLDRGWPTLVPTRAEKNEKLTSSNFPESSSIFDQELARASRCWASRQARKSIRRSSVSLSSSFVSFPALSTDYPSRRERRSSQSNLHEDSLAIPSRNICACAEAKKNKLYEKFERSTFCAYPRCVSSSTYVIA